MAPLIAMHAKFAGNSMLPVDGQSPSKSNGGSRRAATTPFAWATYVALVCLAVTGCQPPPPAEKKEGFGMTGIDHLADHLSVQDYYLDGNGGFQAGKGARDAGSVMLPIHWRPGLTVKVRWNVTNWRDCTGENFQATVPVLPYKRPGRVYTHFMADGSVVVVSTDEGILAPEYPGPHDPIPQKYPWKKYPP